MISTFIGKCLFRVRSLSWNSKNRILHLRCYILTVFIIPYVAPFQDGPLKVYLCGKIGFTSQHEYGNSGNYKLYTNTFILVDYNRLYV